MLSFEKMTITTPGSTANLGPGFDSVGLALNRYLTLVISPSDKWEFVSRSEELKDIPAGKDNLIYVAAEKVAQDHLQDLPACQVEVYSEIPLSRGLGSSASAIIAGIELANQLLELNLTDKEKLRYASIFEGHPDNVAASLFGGLVIGSHREDDTDIVLGGGLDVDIVAVIPDYELQTKLARSALPETMEYAQAVQASSVSNVLIAALLQRNWELAGKMMVKDLFHQPYRSSLVPELDEVLALTKELGAYGVTLSGAGPIVLSFSPRGTGENIQQSLEQKYQDGYRVEQLQVDEQGVVVEIEVKEKTSLS